MNCNVLLTGGAGFIGSNLALRLLEKGYDVSVLDNLSPQVHGDGNSPLYLSIKGQVDFVRGDVCSKGVWDEALHDKNVVVHLAAETGTGQSMYQIAHYTNVNVQGTAILLDCLTNRKHTVRKVVVASSRAVYGEGKYICGDHGVVYPEARQERDLLQGQFDCTCPHCGCVVESRATDEGSQAHPTSVYGITKQSQEQMVLTICKSLGIPAIAFRYQNVYGPGQSLSNPYTGILSIFSTQIKNHSDLNIFEDGKESRDFVYIDDVVEATVLGIENTDIVNEVFNVGSGQSVAIHAVAETLIRLYGSDVTAVVSRNFRAGDIRHNYADLAKIKNGLGFSPKCDFEKGVAKFVEWVNAQEIMNDSFIASMDELSQRGLFK